MVLNRTITKKILENIVHESFSNLGFFSTSSLLDSLKFLGFYYATNAGISINIEDLKTPNLKKSYIQTANKEIQDISEAWSEGLVSDEERFQSIIDSWNIATESLKNRIVDYYQNFDPLNNLYIMAFSGARGNMSQVRQLVGMRGLMSDQEGKIIDLPIQTNFREGLTSIDYIISSYGARKGIVDTALKTADSGYLTRRLIFLAQDLIIRELDCKTKKGILILLKKNSSIKNLIGRTLLSIKQFSYPYEIIQEREELLSLPRLNEIHENAPYLLTIRSSLTCQSNGSICQKCYGWDLSHQKIISLGETVGIIAAQSIGEPGTQLTMRTFHTGGIFTGETLKQIMAPFSGKIIIPDSLKTVLFRTNHGLQILKLQQEATIRLINWKGHETNIFLEIGSYLYISKTSFIYKNQLIAEFFTQSIISGNRKVKPVYTLVSGKVTSENQVSTYKDQKNETNRLVALKQNILWISAGKIFSFSREAEYYFSKILSPQKSIGRFKIITPIEGFISITASLITVLNKNKKIVLDLTNFQNINLNTEYSIQFVSIIRNYQYVDSHTILGYFYIIPNSEGTIFSIEKKEAKFHHVFLISTEDEIWRLYSSGYDKKHKEKEIEDREEKGKSLEKFKHPYYLFKNILKKNEILNSKSRVGLFFQPKQFTNSLINLTRSGILMKKDRSFSLFNSIFPISCTAGTILNYCPNDFVLKDKIFANLVNYTQQTDDIVQGLPKIEELIEARKPAEKEQAKLARRPGIILEVLTRKELELTYSKIIEKNNIYTFLTNLNVLGESIPSEEKKQILLVGQSLFLNQTILTINNQIFKVQYLSPSIELKNNLRVKAYKKYLLGKLRQKYWKTESFSNTIYSSLKFKNYFSNLKDVFYSSKLDYILETIDGGLILLEDLGIDSSLQSYNLLTNSKVLFQPGQFVDIGEPITDGNIDIHELLQILFIYHSQLDGILEGTRKSLSKFQLLLINSIQSIYQAQSVNISSKHIEIIVKQMTAKVSIKKSGSTPFLKGDLIELSLINEIYLILRENKTYEIPYYEPKLLSATTSSLNKDGFLSSAGFQETRKILSKSAIEGTSDWLRGLKESIMIGKLIPAGSSFLNYKNYLDNFYQFKIERI